jgi:hypothetical protein
MKEALSVLEEAISDVGYWRWWSESLPSLFAVEFGGIKLWSPPTAVDRPPSGIVGIGFKNPSLVAFISSDSADHLRPDWRIALHNDEIEPFGFFDDVFTLQDSALLGRTIEGCSLEYLVGSETNLYQASPSLLAFRAGPVGLIVRGEQMAIQPFSEFSDVVKAREAWQGYWVEYWARRDTGTPMPKDYACEVCIPVDRFLFHEG